MNKKVMLRVLMMMVMMVVLIGAVAPLMLTFCGVVVLTMDVIMSVSMVTRA